MMTMNMHHRNSLFYVLTQIIGITALLAWIAYRVQYSGIDTMVTGALHGGSLAFTAPPRGSIAPSYLAATGFLLFGLYFSGWALNRPRMRWGGLAIAAGVGLLVGFLQIRGGAHYLSQTIWSAAGIWLLCSILFYPLVVTRHRKKAADDANLTLEQILKHLSGIQVQRRATFAVYGVLLACMLPFIASVESSNSITHQAVEWIGLAMIFAAILGRCWCILYLGGRKCAELMEEGPYSISRNPLYVFSLIAVAGIGAQSGSLLLGPILALFVFAVFNNVIDEEERLLRNVFGPRFDAYCARVPRFGPRLSVWRTSELLTISTSGLWNTLRDALPYLLAIPLFELIEWGQDAGWLPVLVHLY